MIDVAFREVQTSDIELLLEFMKEFYEHSNLAFNESAARASVERLLDDESLGKIWLLESRDGFVGYIALTLGFSLEFHGRDAFIDEIYVREQYRGQGIGRSTIKFVEGFCQLHDVKALHVEVERDNEPALGLYRALRFTTQNSRLMTKQYAD